MSVNLDTNQEERALGMQWDVVNDSFFLKVDVHDVPTTKRGILKVTSSIFDLLGFMTPFVLKAKMILQELWRRKCEWDSVIDQDIQKIWKNWKANMKDISEIKIQRCYTGSDEQNVEKIELHIFCDASNLAFGCVAYLRFCYIDGRFRTSFVMAKSKLAPIRTMSLPRLELSSAVSAVRLCKLILNELELEINQVYFWTDSTLNLQYISNEKFRFKTFVANRIAEIHENTDRNQWKHIPGNMNPADLVTRGVTVPSDLLKENKFGTCWLRGPAFLTTNIDWPHQIELSGNESIVHDQDVNRNLLTDSQNGIG